MHFNVNVLTVTAATVATLWLSADAAIIPDSLVRRSTAAEPALNIPDLIPQSVVHGGKDDRRWSTRLRDTVVGKLFGTADRHGRRREQHKYLSQMSKIISQYDGDVVLRFNLSSPEEGKALAEASNILYLDVWSTTKTHADIRMAEAMVPSVLGLLPDSMQHSHFRLMHDLAQTALDTYSGASNSYTEADMKPTKVGADNLFFQSYQPPTVILPWMKLLESLFPGFVEVTSIGRSYEGREIHALKVGTKAPTQNKKMTIIVTGAAHAREWISVSTVCYLAYSLIEGYGKTDMDINSIVDHFNWIFIPTLNVDGYAYTWEGDRLWRKNRQPTKLSFCKGIDLDRAYNFHFDGSPSAQGNPCSDSMKPAFLVI
ncbi:putative metallocarboxypeptidase ecm14 [Maublancomyces gigas]|uniref:Inactive metallocarboxypeptidase ECM14 n=1 Tax=Discina gigas TaxID=1032678 RepID=A0ABR3GMJ0_9PEZI